MYDFGHVRDAQYEDDDNNEDSDFGTVVQTIPITNLSGSGRSTPDLPSCEYRSHRKSVSFDLCGDERKRNSDGFGRCSDSEQGESYQSHQNTHFPRKGILRSASPSNISSNSSSVELGNRVEKVTPILPTVARVMEIESSIIQHAMRSRYHKSTNEGLPSPAEPLRASTEIERENPFREAFLHDSHQDKYTELARAFTKSPKNPCGQLVFSSDSGLRSADQDTNVSHAAALCDQNLPLPQLLTQTKIKQANIIRNTALETFQGADAGHGDFAVFEHDIATNTIREVKKTMSPTESTAFSVGPGPKLPVRVKTQRIPSRRLQSPPPPPVNYATLPKLSKYAKINSEQPYLEVQRPSSPALTLSLRPTQFSHENSLDNILVTVDEHRAILLRENDLRNKLRDDSNKSQIPELDMSSQISDSPVLNMLTKHSMSPQPETLPTKIPKSVSDKLRFFESAMEDQHKPIHKAAKIFSFLSKDEVEKLHQEEERKIATLRRNENSRDLEGPIDDDFDDFEQHDIVDNGRSRSESKQHENIESGLANVDLTGCGPYDDEELNYDAALGIEKLPKQNEGVPATAASISVPTTTTTADTSNLSPPPFRKPSLLPKPKVKVVMPPLLQQQRCHHHHHQQQQREQFESLLSRIPVRTANAEKRATVNITASVLSATSADTMPSSEQTPAAAAVINETTNNAQNVVSWRAGRLRSFEEDSVKALEVNRNMVKVTDALASNKPPPITKQPEEIVFPKITVKSSEGPVIIREREKILDEKIVCRTEDVPCPITGRPRLCTVEYIEKIIETEVETCREKIISLELQDPEKDLSPLVVEARPEGSSTFKRTSVTYIDNEYTDDRGSEKRGNDFVEFNENDEEEDDTSSVVTVEANDDKLFLKSEERSSNELEGVPDLDHASHYAVPIESSEHNCTIPEKMAATSQSVASIQTLGNTPPTITLAPTPITTSAPAIGISTASNIERSIVEVVNPIIMGEGQVQSIAVSYSDTCDNPGIIHCDEDGNSHGMIKDEKYCLQSGDDYELPICTQVLRSETFVLPPFRKERPQELSLNAKMKNVLEELIENERVKFNLQKSLEEDETQKIDNKFEYFEGDYSQDGNHIYCGGASTPTFTNSAPEAKIDNNGNRNFGNELTRDSNRNTFDDLAFKLQTNDGEREVEENERDEAEGDSDGGFESELKSEDEGEHDLDDEEDSDDSDDSDSDRDEVDDADMRNIAHMTFVDGCQVIENFNTQTPTKLQKSQTYTSMLEAAVPSSAESVDLETERGQNSLVHRLELEQRELETISRQLRQSLDNLLNEQKETGEDANSFTEAQQKGDDQKEPSIAQTTESGEELFNRLLAAGEELKQIFDQQTDVSVTTTTQTDTQSDGSMTIHTKTTTVSNAITTSGIPTSLKRTNTETAGDCDGADI